MSADTPSWHSGWSHPGPGRDPFRITVTRPTATTVVVTVVGDLDIATCPMFDAHLDELLQRPAPDPLRDPHGAQGVHGIVVDLTRLELLSAAGVRSLLRADAAARAQQVQPQWVITHHRIGQVLSVFGLDGRLSVQPDLSTARNVAARRAAERTQHRPGAG